MAWCLPGAVLRTEFGRTSALRPAKRRFSHLLRSGGGASRCHPTVRISTVGTPLPLLRPSPFLLASLAAPCLPAQNVDPLRDAVREALNTSSFSLFTATFVGLTDEAELSGGGFRIKAPPGEASLDLDVLTIPWHRELDPGEGWPMLRAELSAGYASAELDIGDLWSGQLPGLEARAQTRFQAVGGAVGIGPQFRLADKLQAALLGHLGAAYVRNHAEYSGPGAALAGATFDGLLFNWDTTYFYYGGSVLLAHDSLQWGEVTLKPHLRYDVRAFDPVETDDASADATSTVQWLVARLGLEGPTGWTIDGGVVRWEAGLGAKVFDEAAAQVLGFRDYVEVGAGLRWSCGDALPLVQKFGLAGAVFYGDDLFGWTLGVVWEF
ncbi:MAG: hypothetical protein RL398_635 [Planctomycetota bacterium]|jgi:hypothetical protein